MLWDALPTAQKRPHCLATSSAVVLLSGDILLRVSSELTSIRIPSHFMKSLCPLSGIPRCPFFISMHCNYLLCICLPRKSMPFLKARTWFCFCLCPQHLTLGLGGSRLSMSHYCMNVLAKNKQNRNLSGRS